MKKIDYLGALDLGSQTITFLLAEVRNQHLNLIGHAHVDSKGIRKACLTDSKALTQVLSALFDQLSKKYHALPSQLYLSQSGNHMRNVQYETTLSLKGFQHIINESDIAQITRLALKKELPEGDVFLHQFKQHFIINNEIISYPVGHTACQLSVCYNGLFGKAQAIKDQLYAVNQFGFRVKELTFSGIASALATTTSVERENGVCVIDIGAQMTEFVVYKGQQPCIMGTLPVGSQNFTYDLSSGLRIHSEDAERLKVEQGIPDANLDNEQIWVLGNQSIGDKKIKLKNFRTILQARAQELFDYIAKFVNSNGLTEPLLSGVILTGGGALVKGIEKIAAHCLRCDCCVRGPLSSSDEALKSPSYSTCFGLLHSALQQKVIAASQSTTPNFWEQLKSWFGKG